MKMQSIKVVAVGDGAVGKTCIMISFTTNSFPSEYLPTVFDNYSTTLIVDGKATTVGLCDTAGQEDYDRLRPLSYPNTDVFLVCFSVMDMGTYVNAKTKWAPEVTHYNPDTPMVIVGTKIDLRGDWSKLIECDRPLSYEEGVELMKETGASKYMECSAYTQVGLLNLFEEAVRVALNSGSSSVVNSRGVNTAASKRFSLKNCSLL